MDLQMMKRIFFVLILMFVVVLAFGEKTQTFYISDSEDAMTGFTNMKLSNSGDFVTDPSASSFYLYYTTPTTLGLGEKIYYKFQAYEQSSSSAEKQLYQNLAADQSCSIRQKGYNADTNVLIFTGSWHGQFNHHVSSAAGNYYELDTILWSTSPTPHKFYVKVYYTCDGINEVLIDTSKTFAFEGEDDTQEQEICELKDNSYCGDGQLITRDYTYVDGVCKYKIVFSDNDECYKQYMIDKCQDAGLIYDSSTKSCKSEEVIPKTCDGQAIDSLKCFDEIEKVCDETGNWVSTGTTNCESDITCDGEPLYTLKCFGTIEKMCTDEGWLAITSMNCLTEVPLTCGGITEGAKQCFGETEAQCINGDWVELDSDVCKTGIDIKTISIIVGIILFFIVVIGLERSGFSRSSAKGRKKR